MSNNLRKNCYNISKPFCQYIRNQIIFKQSMICESTTLDGKFLKLIPLTTEHANDLYEAGKHKEIWIHTLDKISNIEDMRKYIGRALESKEKGLSIPYSIYDKKTNTLVGSSRYYNIDKKNYNSDIGYTWISPNFQKSYINTEAKLLMLSQAFEKWNSIRVGFKISPTNIHSQKAVERLGATKEGTLRNIMVLENGLRDSVVFSILDSEWFSIKQNLEKKLNNFKI